MIKTLYIFIWALFFLSLSLTRPASAEMVTATHPEIALPDQTIEAKKLDKEALILSQYLAKHNSPLQYHAQDFVDAAKQYELDWRLVAAISGVESTFGKHIPGGYNGWGWGVYGTQALYFQSWKDGIYTVSKGLRENYMDKGYTEPYAMNRIYAASPAWGGHVVFFMNDLARFAEGYESEDITYEVNTTNDKVAASSGLLASQ